MRNAKCNRTRAHSGSMHAGFLHFEVCILNFVCRAHSFSVTTGIAVLALLLAAAPPLFAQAPAECATADCAAAGLQSRSSSSKLWTEAAAIHRLKLEFV